MADTSDRSGDSFRENLQVFAGRIVSIPDRMDSIGTLAIEQFNPPEVVEFPIADWTVFDRVASLTYSIGDEVVVEVRSDEAAAVRVSRLARASEGQFVRGDDLRRNVTIATRTGVKMAMSTVEETQFTDGQVVKTFRSDAVNPGEEVGVYFLDIDQGAERLAIRVANSEAKASDTD